MVTSAPMTVLAATGVMEIERPFVVSVMVPAPAMGACEMETSVPLSVQLLVPMGALLIPTALPEKVVPAPGAMAREYERPMSEFVAVQFSFMTSRLLTTPAAFEMVTGRPA